MKMNLLMKTIILVLVAIWREAQVTDAVAEHGSDPWNSTCVINFERPKRIFEEQCVDNRICKVYSLSTLEKEQLSFTGMQECVAYLFAICTPCEVRMTPDECEEYNVNPCEYPPGYMAENHFTPQWVTDWMNDVTVPETTCTEERCGGGSVGDPHFITFDGLYYNYHGECDLVLTESSTFGDGKGLDVHIRTTIEKLYSYISGAAIRIGADILEVEGSGKAYFNGKEEVPSSIAGFNLTDVVGCSEGFFIHKTNDASSGDAASCTHPTTKYTIELPKGEALSISATEGMLKVDISALFEDAAGMAGTVGKKGMVARDGETVFTNPKDMGTNWQVNSTQLHLFREQRDPQHPQPCKLPNYSAAQASRRLGQDLALHNIASEACASVKDKNMREACEFDVIQTQNRDMAIAYRM